MLKQAFSTLVVVALLSLLLVSCGGATAASSNSGDKNAMPAKASTDSSSTNSEATGFQLLPLDGPGVIERVHATKGKAVLVDIWGTWCAPCVKKFPTVMELRKKYAKSGLDVVFVAVEFDDAAKEARKFLKEQGVDFTTYLKTGNDTEFIDAFDSDWNGTMPMMFLYDADGKLLNSWSEAVDHEVVEKAIEELLMAHS